MPEEDELDRELGELTCEFVDKDANIELLRKDEELRRHGNQEQIDLDFDVSLELLEQQLAEHSALLSEDRKKNERGLPAPPSSSQPHAGNGEKTDGKRKSKKKRHLSSAEVGAAGPEQRQGSAQVTSNPDLIRDSTSLTLPDHTRKRFNFYLKSRTSKLRITEQQQKGSSPQQIVVDVKDLPVFCDTVAMFCKKVIKRGLQKEAASFTFKMDKRGQQLRIETTAGIEGYVTIPQNGIPSFKSALDSLPIAKWFKPPIPKPKKLETEAEEDKRPNEKVPATFPGICQFFLEGKCTRKNRCRWSHGEEEEQRRLTLLTTRLAGVKSVDLDAELDSLDSHVEALGLEDDVLLQSFEIDDPGGDDL